MLNLLFHVSGTPRASAEVYDEASKYGKQIKRESPPIRSFEGGITKGKPYEGVNTIRRWAAQFTRFPVRRLKKVVKLLFWMDPILRYLIWGCYRFPHWNVFQITFRSVKWKMYSATISVAFATENYWVQLWKIFRSTCATDPISIFVFALMELQRFLTYLRVFCSVE